MTCCVTCYFDSDFPYVGKCFFRLESCALNRNDRGLSFCYFFLVSFLHFDPLVLCNLIFFGRRIITTIVPLKNIILRLPVNNAIGLLSSILSKLFRREVYLCFFFPEDFPKAYDEGIIPIKFFYLHKTLHWVMKRGNQIEAGRSLWYLCSFF